MKRKCYLFLSAFLMYGMFVLAQTPSKQFVPFKGQKAVKRSLSELHGFSAARTGIKQLDSSAIRPLRFRLDEFKKFRKSIHPKDVDMGVLKAESQRDSKVQNTMAADAMENPSTQQVWSNFLASTFYDAYSWPPDPNGAVGPTQVAVLMNAGLKIYDKPDVNSDPLVTTKGISNTPAPAKLFITLDQFFSPVLADSSFTSDPHVRYDRLTKRWFIVAIDVNPYTVSNNHLLIAVSDGDEITDASNFSYYSVPISIFPLSSTKSPFLDYPTLGVDKNALMIGGVDFISNNNTGFTDSVAFVGFAIDKQSLIHGQLGGYLFLLGGENNNSANGMIVPQGVQNDDPAATRSYFAGISANMDGIQLMGLTYNAKHQITAVSASMVPVEKFQFPRDVTAPGSPMPIDPLDTRLFAASIHKNKYTGKSSLWTAHVIGVNQSGHYVPDASFNNEARTASRWYEIDNIYTAPQLNQLGTVYDDAQASGRRAVSYFNASIAANGQGHALLGGTTAAYNKYLNAFVTGRYYEDPNGKMEAPQRVTSTSAIYAPQLFRGYYIGRWGDFSQTVVDPLDDQTMWTFQEYANADDSYGVRAIQVKAPPPPMPKSLGELSNTRDTVITLKGMSEDHSAFFDPGKDMNGPGYNRLSIKSTGRIIVSQIKLISPTEVRFKLNTRGKPAGEYTLVITNPDGQFVVLDFTIGANTVSTTSKTVINKGIEEAISASGIFPNPTKGDFKLLVTTIKATSGRIVLMEASGKQIYEKTFNFSKGGNEAALSLANQVNGTYFAAVYNEKNVLIATHRIVKQ